MATKEHVVKVVNGATERAVMVSPTTPVTPIDSQIWFDNVKQQLAIFSAGNITPLNCRVLAGDPPAPLDGETWVNQGTNEFKYRYLGSTYSISLGANTGNAVQPVGNYYAILTEEELGQLSNIGALYPNFITDAFNSIEPDAVYSNALAQGSALRLVDGQNAGNVKYNLPTSTVVNDMEGIAVYTPNAMVPLTIVNNGDGTSTVTAAGDMTPYLATARQMMFYQQLVDSSGNVSSIYATGNDNNPLVAPIVTTGPAPASNAYPAPAYVSGITTFTVQTAATSTSGVDLVASMGSPSLPNVRFFSNNLVVQAGGEGTAGSMDTVKITDAHGLAQIRTLGANVLNFITQDLTTNINKINVKKSPLGQYCLIQVVHTLAADYQEFVYYYSNDSMLTLNRIVPTYPMSRATNEVVPYDNLNSDSSNNIPGQFDRLMQINDSGKFVLIQNMFNDAGYTRARLCYGDLTQPSPVVNFAPGIGDGPGVVLDSDGSPYWQGQAIVMDPSDNYVVVNVVNQSNHLMRTAWYSAQGATFMGISDNYVYDYNGNTASKLAWYTALEGVPQAVYIGIDANNGYAQVWKKKISEIVAALPYTGGNQTAFEMLPAFANQTNQYMITTEGSIFPFNISADSDKLRTSWWSDSNDRMIYGEIDMISPNPGRDEIQLVSFSAVPTSGQWNLEFGGDTTSPNFGFGDNASVVQAALRALPSINGPYVNVTGNYTAGFTVEFVSTMGLQPQALLINPSNTLSNGSPVNINITESQAGQTPVYMTFNGAGFRHLATGDKVLLDNTDNDYFASGGGYSDGSTAQYAYSTTRTWKPHPSNSNRAFCVMPRANNQTVPYGMDAQVYQLDNLATFQGCFNDTISSATASALSAVVSANNGDRIGGLITWDRGINVRTIAARIALTWASYSIEVPRGQNISIGAKLVGVSGGVPNESVVYEISPTTYNIYDYQQPNTWDLHFRFNQTVTNGQQMYLVLFMNNMTPSVDWPVSNGGTQVAVYGPAGSNAAYFQGGIWTVGSVGFGYRAYDFDIEPVKTPDMNSYPMFDLTQSATGAAPGGTYGQISEVQLDYNPSKTALQLSYTMGARFDGNGSGSSAYVSNRTVCYRTFNVPASGTFMSDLNVGSTATFTSSFASGASSIVVSSASGLQLNQRLTDNTTPGNLQAGTFITTISGTTIGLSRPTAGIGSTDSITATTPTLYYGYDPATYDHNLLFHTRLADPTYPMIDRFGNARQIGGNSNQPMRGIDIAGGAFFNYNSGNQFLLNNVAYGQAQDARFKSGWAMRFGSQGDLQYYIGLHGSFKGGPFAIELEYVPTATDIASGGYLLQYGNGNGWYLYVSPGGSNTFVIQNQSGPTPVTGGTTTTSSTMVANQYYRIRITRDDSSLIHIYWSTVQTGGYAEQPYTVQANMVQRTLYSENDNLYVGAAYDNTSAINGYLGEIKMTSGSTSFLNGDGIADQRPIIGHHNLGDRIIGKQVYDGGVVNGTADDSRIWYTKGIMATPTATTALRAGYDQMFTYQDTNLPQGKLLGAELSLSRVSAADAPAVQGFLFNYQKLT